MPNDRRVGALDHPERYGCKSLAVYTNTVGRLTSFETASLCF